MSSTLKPGNASRMVTIWSLLRSRPDSHARRTLVDPLRVRRGSGSCAGPAGFGVSSARGRRSGVGRRSDAPRRPGSSNPAAASAPVTVAASSMSVERMRQLVVPEPGERERRDREERRHEPGDEERRREPDRLADGPGDRHRDRHERERHEEVEARHAAEHRRRHPPLQQRAPHDLGAVEQHADDEQRDDHDPEPGR